MRKRIHFLTTAAAIFALTGAVFAAETLPGKKLVEEKCMGCHKTEKYTAANRKVTSLDALQKQVAACAAGAKLEWTDAQKAEVVTYLNQEFYKFK
ncbi:MAG: cytochrome c [Proteobacteria bacterium]|nr:cytochrome c [Pseudomonadota bacterium]